MGKNILSCPSGYLGRGSIAPAGTRLPTPVLGCTPLLLMLGPKNHDLCPHSAPLPGLLPALLWGGPLEHPQTYTQILPPSVPSPGGAENSYALSLHFGCESLRQGPYCCAMMPHLAWCSHSSNPAPWHATPSSPASLALVLILR